MTDATVVNPEIVECFSRARAAVDALPARPSLSAIHRRTLERLRDRLRDEERDATSIFKDTYRHLDHMRQLREEVAAIDAALAALPPQASA